MIFDQNNIFNTRRSSFRANQKLEFIGKGALWSRYMEKLRRSNLRNQKFMVKEISCNEEDAGQGRIKYKC